MERRIPASMRTREALSALIEGRLASPAGGQIGDIDPARDRISPLQLFAVNFEYLAMVGR